MLNISILDKIKTAINHNVVSKKSHLDFAHNYQHVTESMRHEIEKLRNTYDSACYAVDVAKEKFEKSRLERSAGRHKLAWHQEILEMHNLKNEYLLALQTYNKTLDHGRDYDLPKVTGQFESYAVGTNSKLLDIWKSLKSAENEIFRGLVDVSTNTLFAIENALPELGTEIDKSNVDFENLKLYFIPCQLWRDDVISIN